MSRTTQNAATVPGLISDSFKTSSICRYQATVLSYFYDAVNRSIPEKYETTRVDEFCGLSTTKKKSELSILRRRERRREGVSMVKYYYDL